MTRDQFISKLVACYRIANLSDSDSPDRADWTSPTMAYTTCSRLDAIFADLRECGVLSNQEHQAIYDQM